MPTFSAPVAPIHAARRLLAATAFLGVASAGALSGCKALTSIDASFDNVSDSGSFYPINGSPPGVPTAIQLFTGVRQNADQTFAYDIAFDIASNGKVVLIPARALATGFSNPYSVGLQIVPGVGFGTLDHAPKDGYVADSTLQISIGQVVAIESHDAARCGFAIKGSTYFSKLVVTAVDTTTRKITTQILIDRNCGFRSFESGRPKD